MGIKTYQEKNTNPMEKELAQSDLGKPPQKKCHFYLGIAQIAIAPPPRTQPGTLGHFIFRPIWATLSNHRFDGDKCPKASWQALTPSLTQANTHLNFNFHCISAPNHPGKHFDPPTIKQIAHLNLDNSSLNKCPKPSWQAFRPPPHAQLNREYLSGVLP